MASPTAATTRRCRGLLSWHPALGGATARRQRGERLLGQHSDVVERDAGVAQGVGDGSRPRCMRPLVAVPSIGRWHFTTAGASAGSANFQTGSTRWFSAPSAHLSLLEFFLVDLAGGKTPCGNFRHCVAGLPRPPSNHRSPRWREESRRRGKSLHVRESVGGPGCREGLSKLLGPGAADRRIVSD